MAATREQPSVRVRADWRALLVYFSVAFALAFTDHRMRRFPDYVVTTYVPQVVQGTAEAPGRYRVLAPFLIDAVVRGTGGPPMIVFLVLRFLVTFGALVAMHGLLRRWFGDFTAVGGTALVAALLPLTYTNSWAHPDSAIELLLMAAGCSLIVSKRDGWFLAVLLLAAFNRETSAFLLLLWAWDRLADARTVFPVLRVLGVSASWCSVFIGLRLVRGFATYQVWMLPRNLSALVPLPDNFDPYVRISGVLWLVLALPLLTLAVTGVRQVGWSSYFGRATVTAGCLLATGLAISSVLESRIFVPLLPLLVPPALVGLGAGLVSPPNRQPARVPSADDTR